MVYLTIFLINTLRPLGYERVYLTLSKVADTPFHIQGDDLVWRLAKEVHHHTREVWIYVGPVMYTVVQH